MFPGTEGVPGRGNGGPNWCGFGPGKPGIDPESTQNSPVLTQIGPCLARKSPSRPMFGSGGAWGEIFCGEEVLGGLLGRG